MGYLGEMSDGNYILYVEVGCITVVKIFKLAEISLDKVSQTPMPNGFYLKIPDVDSFGSNDDDE